MNLNKSMGWPCAFRSLLQSFGWVSLLAAMAWQPKEAHAQALKADDILSSLQNCPACVSLSDLVIETERNGLREAVATDLGTGPLRVFVGPYVTQLQDDVTTGATLFGIQAPDAKLEHVTSRVDDQGRTYAHLQIAGFQLRPGQKWTEKIIWKGYCDRPVLAVPLAMFFFNDKFPVVFTNRSPIPHRLTLSPSNPLSDAVRINQRPPTPPSPTAEHDRKIADEIKKVGLKSLNVCLGKASDVRQLLQVVFADRVEAAAAAVEAKFAEEAVRDHVRGEFERLLNSPETIERIRQLATSSGRPAAPASAGAAAGTPR